jgi:hypothetical protein
MADDRHDGPDPAPPDPDLAAWVAEFGPPIDPEDFRPVAYFNRDGDQIEVYLDNVNYHGRWLGNGLVVHLEEGTDRVVGVTVAGVRAGMREGKARVATRRLNDA